MGRGNNSREATLILESTQLNLKVTGNGKRKWYHSVGELRFL